MDTCINFLNPEVLTRYFHVLKTFKTINGSKSPYACSNQLTKYYRSVDILQQQR